MGEPRTRTGFQFRSMIDAGLEPAAGTDVTGIYLDNINPFLAIYAAVTRQSDAGIFEPGQAISVTEALKMWTIWAAKSMGQADVKGSHRARQVRRHDRALGRYLHDAEGGPQGRQGPQDHRRRQRRVRGEVASRKLRHIQLEAAT